ncbi:MAG TPA: ATP-binding protein, partial [Limnobacter sp.]|uniref:ATP-binding protein n=1 Tax=Limnobacter sp. TaxID=2003368 RepID=UPI002E375820
ARLQDQANALTELAKREIILRANAEQGEKTKAEFLATMSHEIRTPMTAVRGYADLLMDDPLPPESHERVQRIQEASNSLLVIINDILDLSKLEAGRLKLELLSVDVRDLITESLAICRQAAHYDKLNTVGLSYQISGSVPARIMADPTRLRQVLINLIGNALKFTHNGRVKVICEMHKQNIRIAVQDTGIGIEPEVIPNLFADFTQADASINRRYHGTGLGLAICKRLVSLMEGEIGVHSEVGKGSEFWFEIPCVRGEDAEPAQTAPPTELPAGQPNPARKQPLHILIAEDNEMNQKIIQHILDRIGYTYALVSNGQEAVERIGREDFDLVLMDIRMPVMSGLDATRLIRQMPGRNRNIPILAVSADTLEEQFEECKSAGINDFISKPISRSELEKKLIEYGFNQSGPNA